ncbi:MAG: hypothetical protein NVS3B26_15270 [Mycobacteriales bacterium]
MIREPSPSSEGVPGVGWQVVVALNFVIAACYVVIASLIAQGLVRTRQVFRNPLALATAAIFTTCAIHHSEHSLHLVFGDGTADLRSARQVFGGWHGIVVDALGAAVAITYLGLRRSFGALLNTPAMFDDAVRVAAEHRLRELAFTDDLTGVPNRAAYQQYADSLAADDLPVTVCFIDFDGFKAVNDTYGHDAGDRLLHEVAQRISAGLGQERVFRIGGDEFVVIALDLDEVDSAGLVLRLSDLIGQPVAIRDGEIVIAASIGVASAAARIGIDHLLREADADMYQIKGRPLREDVPGSRVNTDVRDQTNLDRRRGVPAVLAVDLT